MRENFNRNKRAREESKKKKRAEKELKRLAKNKESVVSEPVVETNPPEVSPPPSSS